MPKVKDKDRIWKAARENKLVTYRAVLIRLSVDFSKETLQARRDWQEIFKVMKSRDLQPGLLYPAKLSFRIEGQIKSFPDKRKTKGVHHHQTIIIWNVKGTFFKKKKIKTMNNQMAINTYLWFCFCSDCSFILVFRFNCWYIWIYCHFIVYIFYLLFPLK